MNRDPRQILTESLVLAAQSGSEGAFRDLYGLWSADLRRLVTARVEQESAVDEIANDVWLAIARGIHGIDDPACFPRWAFRIVQRRSGDWVRQRVRNRRREALAANEADQLAPMSTASGEPSDDVLRLREVVTQLSSEDRELVEFYYGLERSVAEIATVLELPIGTVKSRLFSVRETLKRKLERKSP